MPTSADRVTQKIMSLGFSQNQNYHTHPTWQPCTYPQVKVFPHQNYSEKSERLQTPSNVHVSIQGYKKHEKSRKHDTDKRIKYFSVTDLKEMEVYKLTTN